MRDTGLKLLPYGDHVLLIWWAARDSAPDEATFQKIDALARRIRASRIPGVMQVFPAFDSLAVIYDPVRLTYDELAKRIAELDGGEEAGEAEEQPLIEVPTVYGGEYGPDLPSVARAAGLTEDEVVRLHSGKEYRVWMVGFLSGFPYAGQLDARLVLPRKASPSLSIRPGSVAIAEKMTGIYPLASPGGWHVIGWTPLTIFDLKREPPGLFQAGYRLRFRAIRESEVAFYSEAAFHREKGRGK